MASGGRRVGELARGVGVDGGGDEKGDAWREKQRRLTLADARKRRARRNKERLGAGARAQQRTGCAQHGLLDAELKRRVLGQLSLRCERSAAYELAGLTNGGGLVCCGEGIEDDARV